LEGIISKAAGSTYRPGSRNALGRHKGRLLSELYEERTPPLTDKSEWSASLSNRAFRHTAGPGRR